MLITLAPPNFEAMDKQIQLDVTDVFTWNMDAMTKYVINQGGTRSSKTYSILQLLVLKAFQRQGITIAIVRKYSSSLHQVKKDFQEILTKLGIWSYDSVIGGQNLTGYKLNSNVFEFHGVDEQKVRGRKRDILLINEANELSYDEFVQLDVRTTDQIFIDFNPSEEFSWIYDLIDNRPEDVTFIKSTYKDNRFIPPQQVATIEALKGDAYKVLALGEKGSSELIIYKDYKTYKSRDIDLKDVSYGLDFGYNHPSALVKVMFDENNNRVFWEQIIYGSGFTLSDIIKLMKDRQVPEDVTIYCDSARPDMIEELTRAGYRATKSDKSVKDGIDLVKSLELNVEEQSTDLLKELRNYKWQKEGDRIIDVPEKSYDDALDAARYATFNWWKKNHRRTFDQVYKGSFVLNTVPKRKW